MAVVRGLVRLLCIVRPGKTLCIALSKLVVYTMHIEKVMAQYKWKTKLQNMKIMRTAIRPIMVWVDRRVAVADALFIDNLESQHRSSKIPLMMFHIGKIISQLRTLSFFST